MTKKHLITIMLSWLIISGVVASDVISERERGFKGSKRAVATIKDALADGNMTAVAASARTMAANQWGQTRFISLLVDS